MRGMTGNRIGLLKRVPMAGELLLGELAYLLAGELIIAVAAMLLDTNVDVKIALGFFEGVLLASVLLIHMASTLEDSVSMYEDEALKHTRKSYIIRILLLLAVFALIFFLKLGDIAAALFGLMALKVSAYIQPFTHKALQKNINEGR